MNESTPLVIVPPTGRVWRGWRPATRVPETEPTEPKWGVGGFGEEGEFGGGGSGDERQESAEGEEGDEEFHGCGLKGSFWGGVGWLEDGDCMLDAEYWMLDREMDR
ncbi:hypothetical protein BPOR_0486g00030 [Botrytis porri]|uniref:Uncharacterized protein n=1 Tax=Botrytis porri TaxID=87229 RepID=A0A4Z1KK03_9HELO|nr:hypothetical protein BPOR_0486g00030 [Botrytis porri]